MLADPNQVGLHAVATILDLARRGHVRIESVTGRKRQKDWALTRNGDLPSDVAPYERALLHGLFDGRRSMTLEALDPRELYISNAIQAFRSGVGKVGQNRGWFSWSPEPQRGFLTGLAFTLFLAMPVILVYWIVSGLSLGRFFLGLASIWLVGLVFRIIRRPVNGSLTPEGSWTRERVLAYRDYLQATGNFIPPVRKRVYTPEQLAEHTPYAVALGVASDWQRGSYWLCEPRSAERMHEWAGIEAGEDIEAGLTMFTQYTHAALVTRSRLPG